jgi:hypothetical protein
MPAYLGTVLVGFLGIKRTPNWRVQLSLHAWLPAGATAGENVHTTVSRPSTTQQDTKRYKAIDAEDV